MVIFVIKSFSTSEKKATIIIKKIVYLKNPIPYRMEAYRKMNEYHAAVLFSVLVSLNIFVFEFCVVLRINEEQLSLLLSLLSKNVKCSVIGAFVGYYDIFPIFIKMKLEIKSTTWGILQCACIGDS